MMHKHSILSCILVLVAGLGCAHLIHALPQQNKPFIGGIPLKGIEDALPQTVASRSDFVRNITNIENRAGTYRGMGFCPPGTWAVGFNQRVQEPQGSGDDTALNSVYLLCADADGHYVDNARSYDGLFGTWALTTICEGPLNFLNCFNIRLERSIPFIDDTAANDVKMTCANGEVLSAGNGGKRGIWGTQSCCPERTAICGIDIKYHLSPNGNGDDTGVTGVTMACCRIPTFSPTRSPTTINGRSDLTAIINNWEAPWGNYVGQMTYCPRDTWAIGFSRKYDGDQASVDRTALNGFSLLCADTSKTFRVVVNSQEGPHGVWNSSNNCSLPNFLECYQIRLQPNQGPVFGPSFDDTGANDVQFRCTDNAPVTAPQAGTEGFWSSPVCCPVGSAVCGLDIKLQQFQGPGHQGDNDDTAMTGLRLACCTLLYSKALRRIFEIDFIFPDNPAPSSPFVAAFHNAAIRWQRTLLSTYPLSITVIAGTRCGSYIFPQNRGVDDLLIIANVAPLERDYGTSIAAVFSPCYIDDVGQIRAGYVTVASERLNELIRDGELNSLAEHHVGHLLGIGSLWASRGFVTTNFKYSGVQGSVQSQVVGGPVPAIVEDQGEGIKGLHWEEGTYGTELMTGFPHHIPYSQLSRMSLGALIDLGFKVNLSMADPYQVDPSAASLASSSAANHHRLRGSLKRHTRQRKNSGNAHLDLVLTDFHKQIKVIGIPKPGREQEYLELKKKFEENEKKRKKV